jgi:phage shock protein A
VAGDEERLQEKARKASARVRKSLKQARSHVAAAHGPFKESFKTFSLLGQALEKNKSYSNHYKELQAALKGVEAAIARAEAACDALDAAPKS